MQIRNQLSTNKGNVTRNAGFIARSMPSEVFVTLHNKDNFCENADNDAKLSLRGKLRKMYSSVNSFVTAGNLIFLIK